MKKTIIISALLTLSASAQTFVELRGASTLYRYADALYISKSNVAFELYYVASPGYNEFNGGVGYQIKPAKFLTLIPTFYATASKEGGRGTKLGLTAGLEKAGWKASGYLAQYWQLGGHASSYLVLDTLDTTKVFTKHLEAGTSLGFLRQDGARNIQFGPTIKWNDKLGAWAISWRPIGPGQELRFGRTFTFGQP